VAHRGERGPAVEVHAAAGVDRLDAEAGAIDGGLRREAVVDEADPTMPPVAVTT
jgi:hypothetical protein